MAAGPLAADNMIVCCWAASICRASKQKNPTLVLKKFYSGPEKCQFSTKMFKCYMLTIQPKKYVNIVC